MPDPNDQAAPPADDIQTDDFDTAFAEFAGGETVAVDEPAPVEASEADNSTEGNQPRDDQGRFTAAAEAAVDDGGEAERDDPAAAFDWDQDDNPWKQRARQVEAQQAALQQQLMQQAQAPAPQPKAPDAAATAQDDAQWKALTDEFPELATALQQRLNAIEQTYQGRYDQLAQQIQPMQQQAEQQFIQGQYQALEAQHPDYQQVATSPAFNAWLGQQPGAVQQMMASTDAADAAWLLSAFKQTQQPASGVADELQARRQKQLAQAQTVPRRGAARVQDDGDFDSMFNHYAEKANA